MENAALGNRPTAPGEFPPIPTNERDLLIEALRSAERVSGLLNEIDAALFALAGGDADEPKYAPLHDLLTRRFSDCSGVHLFVAADKLRMELPQDLQGHYEGEPE